MCVCVCVCVAAYQLIEKQKDWCEARLYCRKHHTDLVSINNQTQNEEALRRGANRTFWIGLKHDNYEWEDGQCSTFRDIGKGASSIQHTECAYYNRVEKETSLLLSEKCGINTKFIICMRGELQHFKSCGNLTC